MVSETTIHSGNPPCKEVPPAAADLEKGVPTSQPGKSEVDASSEKNDMLESNVTSLDCDPRHKAALSPEEDPKNLSMFRKWVIIFVISTGALCVTSASSVAAFTEEATAHEFHVGLEVAILGVSMFVLGLGFGPLLVGPLSEMYGRRVIYRSALLLYWVFTWPVAFAHNIAVFLIFRFLTGFSGAAFLSVAGGTVSDLFVGLQVSTPMAFYTICPTIGPVVGPLISGFINQNTNWRWTYRIFLIWIFVQWAFLLWLVPETFEPVLLKRKAAKLRKSTGDSKHWAPLDQRKDSILHGIMMSCYVPFKHLALDRMALLLDIWAALLLGILYLAFEAFPIIFGQVHNFNTQSVGLSFVGIGIGMVIALCSQPLWNKLYARQLEEHGGVRPPECNLIMGQVGAVLVPAGLFWLAFTTYRHVHWVVPIIASVPFGTGTLFCFTSIFTYLVTAYKPIAASAMAANTFVRTCFAAGFPLFARQMYGRLGTVGATALLAGLTTVFAPLPFVFYRIGERVRTKSSGGAR